MDRADSEATTIPRRRSLFRAFVQDFSPLWFSWCMNAGIIGVTTHQLPVYQFPGLQQISTVAFVIDLVLFILFSSIMLLRLAWFNKSAYDELTNSLPELTLITCWPIAWLTLVAFVALNVSESYWGGRWAGLMAYSMWWIAVVWTLAVFLFTLFTTIRRPHIKSEDFTPSIVVPAVSLATLASIGGLLTHYAVGVTATLAVPVIVLGFAFAGGALVFAIALYGILFKNFFDSGWPEPPQITTLWMLIGPMAQSATALLTNASSASTAMRFAEYDRGTFLTEMSATVLSVVCTLIALLLVGMSSIVTTMAVYGMIETAWRRELAWNLQWNAIIFPTGTLVTALLELSIVMDSSAFRVLAAMGIVFMCLVFLINLGGTIITAYRGGLIQREDPRSKEAKEQ